MLSALTCCLVLTGVPAQNGELKITDARPTYGYVGATRPKTGVLPGEKAYFTFNIHGIKEDAKGRASYTLLVEVMNDKGDKVFQLGPHNAVAQDFLGGNALPCSAHLEIPPKTPPGTYTYRVTIEDRTTKQKGTFETKGKVLPPGFGLVRVGTFADAAGKVPRAPVGVVGESLYLGFSPVGFQRDPKTKQPKIKLSLKILDAKGQPTLPEPIVGTIADGIDENLHMIPLVNGFTLNRTGRFTVELQATDQLAGKTAKVSFPVVVMAAP
jgi:hypothetical protein